MRDLVVDLQLDNLRVDHDKAQVGWRHAVEHRDKQRINANRLTRARRARNECMRHLGQILDDRLVGHTVYAQHNRNGGVGLNPRFGFKNFAKRN